MSTPMKASGVTWIGEVPVAWGIQRYGDAITHIKNRSGVCVAPGSISFGRVVFKDVDSIPLETLSTYQNVCEGDLLLNPINLNYDLKSLRTARSRITTCVSPAYIVARAKSSAGWSDGYLEFTLSCFDRFEMKSLGAGVRQTITFSDIAKRILVKPPLAEQIAVAAYLDKATAIIDKQRALLERKQALLQEQKKAVIHEAVTKGLDGGVPIKASGVDWLGDMPGRWKLKRAGDLGIFTASGIDKLANDREDQVYMFNYLDVYRSQSKIIWPSNSLMRTTCSTTKRIVHAVKDGDVLITPSSETEDDIGHAAVVVGTQPNTVYSYHLIRFRRSRADIDQNYFRIYWNSPANRSYMSFESRGTTRKILNRKSFKKAVIPLPPLDEQIAIADYVDKTTGLIDKQSALIEEKVKLLAELRTSIIHEAVTRGVPAECVN